MSENFVVFIPVAIVLFLLVVVLLTSYVKAPPNRAAVISGVSKKPRILIGRAGLKIPFFERVDWVSIGQIDIDILTEDYIPTKDFINIQVDAVAQVAVNCSTEPIVVTLEDGTTQETTGIEIAMRNFLNESSETIRQTIAKSLQGNLREIIGTMTLEAICQNKAEFSQNVKENAEDDMARLGITILSFNVQNVKDKDGLIEDLGIDNRAQIQKTASIAKANADRDVEIEQAKADNESNAARVRADEEIAKRNNDLEIKKAELKIAEDTKRAEADVAYDIQKEKSRKTLEIEMQNADIAHREKEIELQAREAEVAEKKLDAEIRKPAEAKKYEEMQNADADLYKRQKDAEAKLYEEEKEAEAIRKKGVAEAEAIRAKGEAEADALDKKAEAMAKYGQAAILEMIVNVLPDMAKAVSEPITAIDKVTVIGGDSHGVSDIAENVPVMMAKVMESVKEATGVDMQEIIKASTYDAKVNRKVEVSGGLGIDKTEKEA